MKKRITGWQSVSVQEEPPTHMGGSNSAYGSDDPILSKPDTKIKSKSELKFIVGTWNVQYWKVKKVKLLVKLKNTTKVY